MISQGFKLHIIGAGRGGTSLLAGLVDRHPDCEVHFEEFSTTYLMGRDESDDYIPIDLATRTASRVSKFLNACELAGRQASVKIWGHKTTTEHIFGLYDPNIFQSGKESFDPLEFFNKNTSHIKTIFILRDGRTCIPSKVKRTGQDLSLAIRRWKNSIYLLKKMKVTHSRLHIVKMEDLVIDPVKNLNKICDFLGIQFDEIVLSGTKNEKIIPEYRRNGFDRRTVEISDLMPHWENYIHEELIYCGYL